MKYKSNPEQIEVGVVGLGLMGSSIVVALLIAGHKVKAIAPRLLDMEMAESRIREQLHHCVQSGLIGNDFELGNCQLEISLDYKKLENCEIVFECVIEDLLVKATIYKKITDVVKAETIIATNTSAIAITTLQHQVLYPERFLGIHWAEPAYATRFMEITCGEKTSGDAAERVFEIAHSWGKEPTLLRKDIQGFLTNRLMYAVYRELFDLIGRGRISLEDADKAFRYDAGSWITLMGVFRRMDFTGLSDWSNIFKSIFPTLCNDDQVPPIMQEMVDSNARGTQNFKGLYKYSEEEAKEWEDAFTEFNKDIFWLASFYPFGESQKKEEVVSTCITSQDVL
jgi:3-hydroxybutyryl-CoA dehydrogenase